MKMGILKATEDADVAIVEVGGTVGDIESLPFLEALRQLQASKPGPGNVLSIHVTLVPYIETAGELKTKPTQHSVKEMRQIGIQPDILICRSKSVARQEHQGEDRALLQRRRSSPSSPRSTCRASTSSPSCSTPRGSTSSSPSASTSGAARPIISKWVKIVERYKKPQKGIVRIGIVGKYVHLRDAYKSLHESLVHGALANDCKVELEYIDSEEIEKAGPRHAARSPRRGARAGRLRRPRHRGQDRRYRIRAHEHDPVLRHLPRHADGRGRVRAARGRPRPTRTRASSSETTKHGVIDLMPEQRNLKNKGATMRLGAYPCVAGRRAASRRLAYGGTEISERHRHRYEFANEYKEPLAAAGPHPLGDVPRRQAGRDDRAAWSPVLPGLPVPPRVQVEPDLAPPALRALRARRPRAPGAPRSKLADRGPPERGAPARNQLDPASGRVELVVRFPAERARRSGQHRGDRDRAPSTPSEAWQRAALRANVGVPDGPSGRTRRPARRTRAPQKPAGSRLAHAAARASRTTRSARAARPSPRARSSSDERERVKHAGAT